MEIKNEEKTIFSIVDVSLFKRVILGIWFEFNNELKKNSNGKISDSEDILISSIINLLIKFISSKSLNENFVLSPLNAKFIQNSFDSS